MRYFKIWKRRCNVPHHYERFSETNFYGLLGEIADRILEHKDFDEDEYENYFSEAMDLAESWAREEDGLDCGDFVLYIRDNDFDMFDIKMMN